MKARREGNEIMLEDGDTEEQGRQREILRARGAFRHYMATEINERPFTRPPNTIVWIPTDGSVVAHSSIEDAQKMAENYAGAHPGQVMAVYQLMGFCHTPLKPAPFTAANGEAVMIEHGSEET